MHTLIDKNRLLFLGKHESYGALVNLAWLQCPHVDYAVIECNNPFDLDSLTDFELKKLYKNTTEVDHMGFSREALLAVVHEVITRMVESDIVPDEIQLQAAQVPRGEPYICYGYVKGGFAPVKISDIFEPDGIKLARNLECENAAIAAAPVLKQALEAAPVMFSPSAPRTSTPRSSTPRAPSDGNIEAPKFGSKTGEVWIIAEEIYLAKGKPENLKSIRKEIVEACEAEGINSSTASVQFSKWKNTK